MHILNCSSASPLDALPHHCLAVQIQRFSFHVETTPPQYFSLLCTTIALPSTLCRSVTSLRITDAKHFSAIRGHCFSTLHFSGAFPNIALPLPRQSLQCHFLAVLFHANTQRLSTMTLLVSSPPRRRYDVHHRNVTALCNAVT